MNLNLNNNFGNCNNNNKNNNNSVLAFVEFLLTILSAINLVEMVEIPLEDFFSAYFECRKHKRNTYNALLFEVNYELNLVELYLEVNNFQYEIGKSICFLVRRPKLREVFAADFRDRIVHHVIMLRLEPIFERLFIDDTYNCRKNKGVLHGVRRIYQMILECSHNYTKDCWIAKFDMLGFFMTISKPILYDKLYNLIEAEYTKDDKPILIYLINKVVNNCPQYMCIKKGCTKDWELLPPNKSLFTCGDLFGLPIGNLTSQMFANFYLSSFDDYMKQHFIYYGRYVDDFIIISSKSKILSNLEVIKRILQTTKTILHPNKFYLLHYTKGVKFIGAVIKPGRIYVANTTVANMLKAIHKYNSDLTCDVIHVRLSLNSYLGFLKHYSTYAIKYKLCRIVDPRWYLQLKVDLHILKFTLYETRL